MKYRLSLLAKLDRINENTLLLIVGEKKFQFKHQDQKIIHNLLYCYKKLLLREYVDFSNKKIDLQIIQYLENIGFLIKIDLGNDQSSIAEIRLIHELLSNPLKHCVRLTDLDEISIMESKNLKRGFQLNNNINYNDEFFRKRKSIRNFTTQHLFQGQLANLVLSGLNVSLGKNGYTLHGYAPSAGGFYEINAHVIIFESVDDMSPGLYQFSKVDQKFNKLKNEVPSDWALEGTLDVFRGIHGVVLLSGKLEFITKKYGHRSYLYQLLESGMIQQNMLLYGSLNNISLCTFGGFQNSNLVQYIELSSDELIYTSLLF